jgi:6-phosphogluconolactonase
MLTRRKFLQVSALGTIAAALSACNKSANQPTIQLTDIPSQEKIMSSLHIYVGAYTRGQAKGVALYELNPTSGKLNLISEIETANPSYLALHPNRKYVYAANESNIFRNPADDGISAFAIAEDGSLHLLNQQRAQGSSPCYVCVEPGGKYALTANYMGGNFVIYPIDTDGKLVEASGNCTHSGSGPNAEHQEGPHAHSINVAPGGHFALACDLGLDKVFIYEIDTVNGKLLPHDEVMVKPGSGPRHLDFHPNGKLAYLINEMGGTMTAFNWDGTAGTLKEIQTISTVPDNYDGLKWCADVHVHPNGQFVYGSNRAHDSIVIYRIEETTGKLSLVGFEPTRGKTPRNFAINPTGDLLLVANQDSSNIVIFQIDPASGKLSHLASNDVPNPVCIKFAN